MQIAMLGPLEVRTDSGDLCEVAGHRLRRLVIALALKPRQIASTPYLVDAVWGDEPPADPSNAVQALVSRLRRAAPGITVTSSANGYVLAAPDDAIDMLRFERLVAETDPADPETTSKRLRDALDMWRGPALADARDADFVTPVVARLEEMRLTALHDRIRADLDIGLAAPLVAELEGLVASYPLREPFTRLLMRAQAAAGDRGRALRTFSEARTRLSDELGVSPSAELAAEHLRILRSDGPAPTAAGTPTVAAASTAAGDLNLAPRLTNLRAEITSFVGRDHDTAAVLELLDASRLVTLLGAGGAGKTRLAAHLAREALDELPDGCWMVEFAPVSNPADLINAVLAALDLRESSLGRGAGAAPASGELVNPVERLLANLSNKSILLVFDNCEHVVDQVAALANRILGACPDVRVLATSREPLGVIGESLWPVEPLDLPPADASAQELMAYDSVRLLSQRASAARPGFAVTDANAEAIARICRALDGMPLAIELAAARLRVMSPAMLADRLRDRFGVLTGGNRTALPRHQTLRAVVDWSWDLADEAERALWRRLSVFAGGATLEAVERVCGSPPLRPETIHDTLTALADKSLVVVRDDRDSHVVRDDRDSHVVSDDVSGPRFHTLETIRAYGQLRLDESGERDDMYAAHTAYFAQLAADAREELLGADQLTWFARLQADHDNLQSATRHAISARDAATATRMVGDLGWYWWIRGHRHEGVDLAAAALALPSPSDSPSELRAGACLIGALLTVDGTHQLDIAMTWFDMAHEIVMQIDHPIDPLLRLVTPLRTLFAVVQHPDAVTIDDFKLPVNDAHPWVAATALTMRAHTMLNFGRSGQAPIDDFHRAFTMFSSIGERWGVAFSLTSLASLSAWEGQFSEAIAYLEEALQCLTALSVWEDGINARLQLVRLLWMTGERERAHAELSRGTREAARFGAPDMRAMAAGVAADIARFEGDVAEARRQLERARELVTPHTVGPQLHAMMTSAVAFVDAAAGDIAASRSGHRQALELAVSSSDAPIIAQCMLGLAELALIDGEPMRSALLLGASETVRGAADRSLPDGVRLTEATKAALGDLGFDEGHRRGLAMGVTEIDQLIGARLPRRI